MPDYSVLDRPELLRFLFYPRKDFTGCPPGAFDLFVPVEENVTVPCRFYAKRDNWPWVLHFHGNGEVVADYDAIAPFYHRNGINLAVADYRGYGASGGSPSFSHLVEDAHRLLKAAKEELVQKGFRGELYIMGRSLGSVSALELAYRHPEKIKGLIIESGFASVTRLIAHLAISPLDTALNRFEKECLEMVERISVPALVIHGQEDDLVPAEEAKDLYTRLGSKQKQLVVIPGAGHNDILMIGFDRYFEALKRFIGVES